MSDRKVFVPLSVDKSTAKDVGYFFSPMKMVIAVGSIIPAIILVYYVIAQSSSVVAGIAVLLAYLFIDSYAIRFLVLEERKLKGLKKELDKNKISKSDYFWGVDEVDEEGVIHYKYGGDFKKGVVVKVTRGSLVGTPPRFEDKYNEMKKEFLRKVLNQQLGFLKYTKLERKQMPEGIEDYSNRLRYVDTDEKRALVRMNLDTIARFTKENKSVVADYFVIFNRDVRLVNSFKGRVDDIVNNVFGNEPYFKGSRVLDDDEVIEFFEDVLYIKGVSKRGYHKADDSYEFEDFGKVFRLFDDTGKEIITDFDEKVEEKKVSRLGKGKEMSLDDLKEEMEEERRKEEDRKKEDEEEDVEDIEDLLEEEVVYVYEDEDGNEVEITDEDEIEEILLEEDEYEDFDLDEYEEGEDRR